MKIASRFEKIPPYTPIEPFEILTARLGIPQEKIVKLDANENPFGPSPKTKQALANLQFPHIYPDPENRKLRKALANFTNVEMDYLFPGSGADELIDLIMRVFLEPNDYVLSFPPTFGMYSFDTDINAGKIIEIPRNENFKLNIPKIKEAVATYNPKLLFLTTPNNPDGSYPSLSVINELLQLPTMVVIDEAYIEFTSQGGNLGEKKSLITSVPNRDNLIVLRTFSKWAGLAGLRVGYGAFPGWLTETLWKAKQPYNVNIAASEAAIAALEDVKYLSSIVQQIKQERQRVFEALNTIPFLSPYPSEANFILCKITEKYSGIELKKALENKGILVRHYNNNFLQNFIRISIGKPEENDYLINTLTNLSR